MKIQRMNEILCAAYSGAGGVILPEEAAYLVAEDLMYASAEGYALTALGKRVARQGAAGETPTP